MSQIESVRRHYEAIHETAQDSVEKGREKVAESERNPPDEAHLRLLAEAERENLRRMEITRNRCLARLIAIRNGVSPRDGR